MVSMECTTAQAGSRAGAESVIHLANFRQSAMLQTLEIAS